MRDDMNSASRVKTRFNEGRQRDSERNAPQRETRGAAVNARARAEAAWAALTRGSTKGA